MNCNTCESLRFAEYLARIRTRGVPKGDRRTELIKAWLAAERGLRSHYKESGHPSEVEELINDLEER